MERTFIIQYASEVVKKHLPKISHPNRVRIHRAINDKLIVRPEFFGKPLRQSLKGYRSLRVGNYRVVYKILNKKIVVLAIQKRAIVYAKVEII